MGSITLLDWAIWLVYLAVIILLFWIYRASKSETYYRYFIPGLAIKIVGGLGFALIYVYYYGFGDTFLYHRGAMVLSNALVDQPLDYFRLLQSQNNNLPPDLYQFSNTISYSRGGEEWFMVKLLSPITFLSFNSYLVTTLLMSVISFFGSWRLFQVFSDVLENKKKLAFVAAFLIPSTIFWGGGVMKDTITLTAISLIIYHFYFWRSSLSMLNKLKSFAVLIVCAYLIINLKAYVLLAFIPAIVVTIYYQSKNRISNPLLKFIAGPILFIGLVVFSFFALQVLTESSNKYNTGNLTSQVKGFHTWHSDIGGSTYDLGVSDYSLGTIASKIPESINVTFFRPYPWEARNIVTVISALESLTLFGLFIWVLFMSWGSIWSSLTKKPLVLGLLVYALIFGFAIGFTTYNFGALARYKIPVYGLFVFVLFYLWDQSSKRKKTTS